MATRKSTKTTITKSSKTASEKPAPRRTKASPKERKPFVRTGTWITLIILVLVVAGAYFINKNAEATATADITPTTEEKFVFDATKLVTSIEVKPAEGQTAGIERKADNVWILTKPEETEADQGMAEAAAAQISSLKIMEEIENKDISIFGLDKPLYTITVKFEDGSSSTLEVGDSTPTNKGYYVRLDKQKLMVVSLSGIDALTNLAMFPPYQYTPTPTFTPLPPTETLVPTIEATPTP